MRLGEISKPESDDLFGSDNPLDRLRKYIRLKLPVYFEHGDDPADAYRHQVIVMANEQNFVYTTPGGMAYVPWTMEATRYHGGVKMDDWRFVQRNGDWILQQHMSEPPLSEESDDLFGPQRRTLTAREMSARMNLAAKQVGLDKILYRSGIADFGSGFEYHPLVSINQDGFHWANRNGTLIWATWEGAHEGGGRRWQYYREPTGEYIFHLPVYDDDLDESQDDDLFEPTGKLKVISYDIPQETVYVRSALGFLGVKITKWDVIDNRYFIVDDHEVRTVNNRDITGQFDRNWNTAEFDVEVAEKLDKHTDDWLNEVMPDDVRQAMAEKHFLEESDDLFEPSSRALRVVNWDIPNHTVYVRSALGKLGIQITNWQQFNNEFDNLDSYQIVSVNGRSVTDDQHRAALDKAFKYQVAEQHQDYVETWLSYSIPHEVQTAMQAQQSAVEESDDQELFAPPGRLPKIRQAIKDTIKYYGAQLEYFENTPGAQAEADVDTVDALHEYIGQAEYVLQEFIQGGIAALDNALKNVYPEVVDSIGADLYEQGITLDEIIRQHRNLTEEDDALFDEIPLWKQVDRYIKSGTPVEYQWAEEIFWPVTKANKYGFYWENSNGLDIHTPWSRYVDADDEHNWVLSRHPDGVAVITDLNYLEESDDLFSDVNTMSRLRKFHEQGREIKIADQNGNVWTTVGFLRGRESGQPLMKIQREYQSGYNRHTESLNMTENGLEGADIQPGPGGKIFVYLKPFERTTIEEQDEDLFGEPTRRSKEIGEKLPVITQMMLALRQQNYQRAIGLATAHKLEIPPEYLVPAMTTLLQNPHTVNIALSYLTQSVHQRIPELEPLLLAYIQDQLVNQPSAENYTANRAVEYLSSLAQTRIPGLEEIFSSLRTARQRVSAKEALVRYGSNSAAADQWITRTLLPTWKSPEATAHYLSQVHKGQRIQALEPIVLKKADPALRYAAHNIKQRWPRAEAVIGSNGEAAYYYALYFLKPDRWIEAEPVIARDRVAWSMYARDFLGLNNHTKAGRAQRDAWRQQLLAGQPMTPPPQGPSASLVARAQQQQNPNPINEQDDDLFEPQRLPRTGAIKQLINNQQVRLLMTWDGTVYDVVNVEEVPENVDPYTSHLAGWYEFLVRDGHGLTTITVDPRTHELVRQDDSWLVKERDALVEDQDDDLFEPQRLPRPEILKQLIKNHKVKLILTWQGLDYDVENVEVIPDEGHMYPALAGWYEFLVYGPGGGLTTIDVDPRDHELVRHDDGHWLIKEKDTLTEDQDDDLFEPTGVTVGKINRLVEQHGLVYIRTGTGDLAEIQEARESEYPDHIELVLTTEWGETIIRNYPQQYLSIDYSMTPPRVIVGDNQLQESEDDLFGEPTKMAYVSRLLAALAEFQTEYTMALSAEENRDIRNAMHLYEKGDFIGGNAYLFDLYEENLALLKQYLYDRNLLAFQQRRLPGSLTLRESDDDLFEPRSPKKIAMSLSSAIDKVMDLIRREPIRTMDNGDRATRELQLLKYIQQGVDRGHFKGALELMLDLDDNVQEEIEYQLKRHSGMDINNLRSRYIDESDEDLFEPNQRLQIYRAIRSIADKFEELNTPGLESMQDLVTRYRRIADEFRKSMDQGYRSIWHILSGKYYWQRDLLFNNLKTPYGIDIEDQFLDWVEQGRQQQNR